MKSCSCICARNINSSEGQLKRGVQTTSLGGVAVSHCTTAQERA